LGNIANEGIGMFLGIQLLLRSRYLCGGMHWK